MTDKLYDMKITINKLSILFIIILFCGCSNQTATKSRYEIEKMFHQAEKDFDDAQLKGEFSNPETIAKHLNNYREIKNNCYNLLESITPEHKEVEEIQYLTYQAVSRLSQFYYARKEYDSSATVLDEMIKKIKMKGTPLVETYINLGQSLHAAGKWDSTLEVYDYAIETFYPPVEPSGVISFKLFNLPYHIFQVANISGNNQEAQIHYEYAQTYYRSLISKFPNSPLESAAHANQALLYHDKGLWLKEIEELSMIKDSSTVTQLSLDIKIADLYADKLGEHDKALDRYNKIVNNLTSEDTVIYPLANFRVAGVMIHKKDYSEAREILYDLKKDYRSFFERNPAAQLLLARSFELDGNWKRAEIEYNLLLEKFKTADESLAAYLHIIDHFSNSKRTAERERWINNAQKAFDDLIEKYPSTIIEAKALIFKADLYKQLKEWQNSIAIMLEIFEKFPGSRYSNKAILTAATIYEDELNDKIKADELREKLKKSLARPIN